MNKPANTSKAVKFTFDTQFRRRASDQPNGPLPMEFTAQDLEAAKAEGFAAGKVAALGEIEARTEQLMQNIAQGAAALLQARKDLENETQSEAVLLAHTLARKLAPGLMARVPLAEIEAIVSQVFDERSSEPRLVVRVSDQNLDAVQDRIDRTAVQNGFEGDIILLGEAQLGESDCRVEWADGGIERSLAHNTATIDAILERFLDTIGQPPTPEGEGPET